MVARALIAVTDFGVEETELVEPLNALTKTGIEVTVASNSGEPIQTVTGDKDWASKVNADSKLADVKAADYNLLVIPGGTVNADTLRIDEDGRRLVKEFAAAGKPIGAICHGPWVLIDAGVAKGKTMTSYISIRPDLENAGADWVDKELFRCPGNGWVLLTSRNPNDLPAFTKALVDEICLFIGPSEKGTRTYRVRVPSAYPRTRRSALSNRSVPALTRFATPRISIS